MKSIPFYKVNGAGNDFVFIDESVVDIQISKRSLLAKEVCERKFSVGADGVAFLKRISEAKVVWDFYNADGTSGEMCGNAARCVSVYCKKLWNCPDEIQLQTLCGEVDLKYINKKTSIVEMSLPKWVVKKEAPFSILDSGVPHLVLQVDSIEESEALAALGKEHRYPSELNKKGANVTFVEKNVGNTANAVTYERGVEGFTLACGTGALAAAEYLKEFFSLTEAVEIVMPGGELIVSFENSRCFLQGPAEISFAGELL